MFCKKTFFLTLLTLLIIPINVFAYSNKLLVGGENIGIKLNSKGVMIVGTYEVNNSLPALDAGLKIGDTITSVNGEDVSNIEDMVDKINAYAQNGSIDIGYRRNNKNMKTSLVINKDSNNVYKTGLYVKDSITGIGTLTFIDPNTKIFGALGHEITEKNTGQILEIKDGAIFSSNVTSINPSTNGTAGEKNAQFFTDEIKGNVFENTSSGIFGLYKDTLPTKKLYNVASSDKINKGQASILTVTDGNEINEYKINILKLDDSKNTKNIYFEITDEKLLSLTNGIVQGMSGSPIIQGDYIVGAVTHVVLNDPSKGYGIFITNMLEEAEN